MAARLARPPSRTPPQPSPLPLDGLHRVAFVVSSSDQRRKVSMITRLLYPNGRRGSHALRHATSRLYGAEPLIRRSAYTALRPLALSVYSNCAMTPARRASPLHRSSAAHDTGGAHPTNNLRII